MATGVLHRSSASSEPIVAAGAMALSSVSVVSNAALLKPTLSGIKRKEEADDHAPESVMVADDTAARWTSDRQGVSTGQRSQTPEAVRQGRVRF